MSSICGSIRVTVCLIIFSCCSGTAAVSEETNQLKREEGLSIALGGLEKNCADIKSAEGKLELRREDSPELKTQLQQIAAERKKKALDQSADLEIFADRDQYAARTIGFALLGPKLRFEGSFYDPNRLIVVDGEEYKVFSPLAKQLTIKERHFEVYDYRDPREILFNASDQLHDLLLKSSVREAKLTTANGNASFLRLRIVSGDGVTHLVWFDSRIGYLPVKSMQLREDERSVQFSGEIDYQQVEANTTRAWFPKTATFKVWGPEKLCDRDRDLSTGWRQRFTYAVSNLVINPVFTESDFEISVPAGTQVVDVITGRHYISGTK